MNVYGVVVVDLDNDPCWSSGEFVGAPAGVPMGVRVRVLIGDRRWLALADCQKVAMQVWSAASVEVVPSDPRGIRDLVDYLRRDERLSVA